MENTEEKQTLASLMLPLARLMIESGVTLQAAVEMLKVALVESATAKAPNASASHLSLLTGVHRKDIKRLERDKASPDRIAAGARVLSIWQNDPDFMEDGQPRSLVRGGAFGFDALVGRAKVDAAPATMLAILSASGNVEEDAGQIRFLSASLVPVDQAEKLKAAVATLKPHLDTTIDNVLGKRPQLDQALRYSHLTESAAKFLEKEASCGAIELLKSLNRQAYELQKQEEGNMLFVAGAFTHVSEHDR